MDHHLTLWTVDVVLQMFHNTALAECMKTLSHCGGIYQVPRADLVHDDNEGDHCHVLPYLAGYHLIDRANVDLPLSGGHRSYCCRRVCHYVAKYRTVLRGLQYSAVQSTEV